MKIERLSENQIRCTLYKADLADKELLLTELAYGTDKAKELFRELMQQASNELGFEVDNIPLMIEAIPVSPDCLVLIITKVEDPDELDTRFSRFTRPLGRDDDEDDMMAVDDMVNGGMYIMQLLLFEYLFEVCPSSTIVSDAVATGVGGYEGLLLAAVKFTLGWVYGVGVGWCFAAIGVFIYLFATDVLPS